MLNARLYKLIQDGEHHMELGVVFQWIGVVTVGWIVLFTVLPWIWRVAVRNPGLKRAGRAKGRALVAARDSWLNDPAWISPEALASVERKKRVEIVSMSASELVQALKSGAVTEEEVRSSTGAAVRFAAKISNSAVEPPLNTDPLSDQGHEQQSLYGVSVSVKECIAMEGVSSSVGLYKRLRKGPSTFDAPVVAALKAEGASVIARGNLCQNVEMFETSNPIYGTTTSPWDKSRTPGGSSGGDAALVAAHGAHIGIGTDDGGSIRIPASWNGLVGFRPSVGRVDTRGIVPWSPEGSHTAAVLARSVEDVERVLKTWIQFASPLPLPWTPFAREPHRPLVIAVYETDGWLDPVPAVRSAVRTAKEALIAAGVKVVEKTPPGISQVMTHFFRAAGEDGGAGTREVYVGEDVDPILGTSVTAASVPRAVTKVVASILARRPPSSRMGALLQEYVGAGEGKFSDVVSSLDLAGDELRREILASIAEDPDCDGVDAWMCPVIGVPAVPHKRSDDVALATSYTIFTSFLNVPAASVPVTTVKAEDIRPASAKLVDETEAAMLEVEQGSEGLPLGVQLWTHQRYGDELLVEVCRVVEKAVGFKAPDTAFKAVHEALRDA